MRQSHRKFVKLFKAAIAVIGVTILMVGLFSVPAQRLTQTVNRGSAGSLQNNAGPSQFSPITMTQIAALLAEKDSRTPAQQKIDSQLLQSVRESQGEPMAVGVDLEPVNLANDSMQLMVDIDVKVSDDLISRLEELGSEIIYPSFEYNTIRARVYISVVESIAAFPEVTFIKPAVHSLTSRTDGLETVNARNNIRTDISSGQTDIVSSGRLRSSSFAERAERVRRQLLGFMANRAENIAPFAGTVDSEGDRAHRADDTRNTYGYSGAGIKVGVLSDSFNNLGGAAADIASGNLPGAGNPLGNLTPVTVVQDEPSNGTDEGRAMLQIVHDLAPKAQLFFATADISEASFAANIQALRNAPNNCDIIIDDVFYFDESPFQDGIIAQAVNTVTAAGALYFSSAGNEGSLAKGTSGYFEGDFNDAGSAAFTFPGGAKTGTIHNFGTVTAPVGGNVVISTGEAYTLNWADPGGASNNDYDLFLVSSTGTVKGSSTNIQNGTQNPFEQISPKTLAVGDNLVVFKSAVAAVRAFSLNTVRGTLTVVTNGQTHGHSAAVNAFSVAAAPAAGAFDSKSPTGPFPNAFSPTNKLELFSSDGPRHVFFNSDGSPITPNNFLFATNGGAVRNKPDITAADGVSTTLPTGSGLNPFYGTSAAAPHAGAIAALLKSAKPSLTAAQIRTILTTTAIDIESSGYDINSGFGIIQAFQAMQAVQPTPLADVYLGTVTLSEGSFGNGNGFVDPGETGNVVIQLTNPSMVTATNVSAILATSTSGVMVTQGSANYGSIAAGANASNPATPFKIAINSTVACGSTINFSLTVSFGGGASPQVFLFTTETGRSTGTITSTLGQTPPTGAGFTSTSGQQTGRLTRSGTASSCGATKAAPGLTTTTGSRQFDAYTFTNTSPGSECVTVTMTSTNGINLYTAAYNSAGFVPANPNTNFLADQGSSSNTQSFSLTAPAGQAFTVVVHDINVLPTSASQYSLTVSLAACSTGPACTPVKVTTSSLAPGFVGGSYAQSVTATGGSGAYIFGLTGTLPMGLSFSGNTLSGTPAQSGNFPVTLTASDFLGCPTGSANLTLQIKVSISGDINGDGVIDASDLVLLANILAGNVANFNVTAADVFQDGVVNAADLVTLANFLAGNIAKLPVKPTAQVFPPVRFVETSGDSFAQFDIALTRIEQIR